MTIPETIAKPRGLHISLDLGALHCSDYTNRPTGEEGVACDKRETFIVDPGHTLTDIARYFAELHNPLPQLLAAIEARESEKPKKTDEELIEMMCVAFYGSDINTKKAEWPTTHEHIKGLCRLGMRAALAVVRGNK